MHLRLAAAAMYDRGVIMKRPLSEIQKEIEPIQKLMREKIREAATKDVASCVMAINSLESTAYGHSNDIATLKQKIEECNSYAELILQSLAEAMDAKGVKEIADGDFMVVRTEKGATVR